MIDRSKAMSQRFFIKELILLALFLSMIFNFQWYQQGFERLLGPQKESVEWAPLYELAGQYLMVVLLSSLASLIIAFTIGTLVHLYRWHNLEGLLMTLANFGTTFPTVAVIALLVPLLGYGFAPVVVALVFYGILPILTNTLLGLGSIDGSVKLAASAMGMNRYQQFFKVELPLAMTYIIAGLRTSLIINLAAATVGAVVGAGGLGMPIVSGIRTSEPILILKGALPVGLLALLADALLTRLERRFQWETH